MCSGKCSKCIACTLYPLVLLSIVCNIVLFFPGWDVKYAKEGHITDEVKYMGGLLGGGLLVLIAALCIHMTGENGCENRIGMCLSAVLAAVGVAGAVYSFIVAVLGLANGPLCKVNDTWTTPFKNRNTSYMGDYKSWTECTEPRNVVVFNMGLFFTLMATSCLQVLLGGSQVINGLLGCLCGPCNTEKA